MQREGFPVYDLQDHVFISPVFCKSVTKNTLQGHRPWTELSELWGIFVKLWTKACRVFREVCDTLSPALFIPSSVEFKYPDKADQS